MVFNKKINYYYISTSNSSSLYFVFCQFILSNLLSSNLSSKHPQHQLSTLDLSTSPVCRPFLHFAQVRPRWTENDRTRLSGEIIFDLHSSKYRRECAELTLQKDITEVRQSLQRLWIPPIYGNTEVFSQIRGRAGNIGQEALMDIPSGTPILSETAFFSVEEGQDVTAADSLRPEFQALKSRANSSIRKRFRTNSFEMDDGEHGIFLEAARFNHPCLPNAHFSWNTITQQLTIHAVVDIPYHTEIFLNYRPESFFKTTLQRKNELQKDYRFDCNCLACQPASQQATTINQLRALKNTIAANLLQPNLRARLDRRGNMDTFIHEMYRQVPLYPQLAEMFIRELQWFEAEIGALGVQNNNEKALLRHEAMQAARNKLDLDIRCTGTKSLKLKTHWAGSVGWN